MKIKLDGVMETLLITLNFKAKDCSSTNPILNDKKAQEICSKIDYDFSKFDKAWMSYYGTLSRAYIMDEEIKKFINKNPDCVVVYIGVGLDSRFERVDNGKITWYNIDFPEVMKTRKLFFEENPRVKNISKSALDETWMKDIEYNGKELLIVSEGTFMYLSEEEVKKLLGLLVDNFEKFELHLDCLYKKNTTISKKHDALKKMDSDVVFKWGVTDGREVIELEPRLKQTGYINFTKKMGKVIPLSKKIFIPLLYWRNDRLCIYRYEKN